jgi:hypothetical protein
MPRFLLPAAAAALAAICALATPAGGRAAACSAAGYSYAGLLGDRVQYGVGAQITPIALPSVRGGHVAAWVGVGGEGLGPHGTTEWLQVGISAEPGTGMALYYELALPGAAPRYVMLKGHLQPGESHRVAVLESRLHRGSWRVWVDGSPMTRLIHLPGSHAAWLPVATSESWDGGVGACNSFAFGFAKVSVAAKPGGNWSPLAGRVIDAPGFVVAGRRVAGFVARAGNA